MREIKPARTALRGLIFSVLPVLGLLLATSCSPLRLEDLDPRELSQKLQPLTSDQEESFEPFHGLLMGDEEFPEFAHARTVELFTAEGTTGLAVRISDDGYCLTAAHVCARSTPFLRQVTLKAEAEGETEATTLIHRKVPVEIVQVVESIDLAVIRIPPGFSPGHPLHPRVTELAAAPPEVGARLFSFGNPVLGNRPASGTILRVVEEQPEEIPEGFTVYWIESTLPIRTGDSGGPALDHRGRLVGVNSSIHGRIWKKLSGELEGEFEYSRGVHVPPGIIEQWIDAHRERSWP